jgi:hypothetical protein
VDGKELFDEVIAQARHAHGTLEPARVAALFGVSEGTFRGVAVRCYPLTLPDDAMHIAARQVAAALHATGESGFAGALSRLKSDSERLRVVTLLLQARD